MFKNKKVVIVVLCSILIAFILPLAIDWLIIGNDVPSNISNSDWVDFFGGYIGSVIGAVVSLVGIVITIRYTSEQNKKDRELQVRPYCTIRYVPNPKTISTRKQLGHLMFGCEPQENKSPRYQSVVYIKNVGMGPAIEFDFDVDKIDDGRKHYPILAQRTPESVNNAVNLLQPGEEAIFPISIFFNFDKISEDDIMEFEDDSLGKYYVNPSIQNKYKNFEIKITVKYYDMFQNMFVQTISLFSNMYTSISSDEKKAKFLCDINLKGTTPPVKVDKTTQSR